MATYFNSEKSRNSKPRPKEIQLTLAQAYSGRDFSSPKSQPWANKRVNSPVTDLAINLTGLSTTTRDGSRDGGGSPRRRSSLCGLHSTPTPAMRPLALERQLSADQGVCVASPTEDELDFDSPSVQERFGHILQTMDAKTCFKSAALKRFTAMPVPFCGFSPSPNPVRPEPRCVQERVQGCVQSPCVQVSPRVQSPLRLKIVSPPSGDEENSQDSGIGMDKDGSPDFCFREPVAPAPRRHRVLSDETNSPLKYSPVKPHRHSVPNLKFHLPDEKENSPPPAHHAPSSPSSPVLLRASSLTSSHGGEDDGFLDLEDQPSSPGSEGGAPAGLSGLLTGAVIQRTDSGTPARDGKAKSSLTRRGLFRSPSVPNVPTTTSTHIPGERLRPTFCVSKRQSANGETTPTQVKRRKSNLDLSGSPNKAAPRRPTLQRCHSEAEIKTALSRGDAQTDLIADFSRPYTLPLTPGKHGDLRSITPDTLASVLQGEYSGQVDKCVVVDCRYPYEYKGGHITGAINLYTADQILSEFLRSHLHRTTAAPGKRNILVFHCEFSSERGPKMSRLLRNKDRDANKDCYPSLHYPEVYLLDGGYKAFYHQHRDLCVPQTYLPMLHQDHSADLKHFRTKSKSWAGAERGRIPVRAGLKF